MENPSALPRWFRMRGAHGPLAVESVDFRGADGTALRLCHVANQAARGAVILAPGTAMTGLSLCVSTVQENLGEFLHAAGFDLWLFDWRSSPSLPAHRVPYTLSDVARYDWPAAVQAVKQRTGRPQISVLAHCLSAPSLLLSLLRGHLDPRELDALVLSQVALHLTLPAFGWLKSHAHLERLLPEQQMIHLRPDEVTLHLADAAITALAAVLPSRCDQTSCHRQNATFGGLLQHDQINPQTHALLGELIPEVSAGFLHDVASLAREDALLGPAEIAQLPSLALPITLISGEHNQTLLPESTAASYRQLCEASAANAPLYRRQVIAGYGHLDCLIGQRAFLDVFPLLADSLGPGVRARRDVARRESKLGI